MILIIKHIGIEGAETLGAFFRQRSIKYQEIDLSQGAVLPAAISYDVHAVISLGGPMNVYEQEKYPFLADEDAFLRKVIEQGVPFLGICLGSQLLAKASGARVKKSPQQEIGFSQVRLTETGRADPLFKDVGELLTVYQWHEDMFEVPPDGSLLARSESCPHQAFRIGRNAYGLQFHIEITNKSILEWSSRYKGQDAAFVAKQEKMLQDYRELKELFDADADKIYSNFLEIVERSKNGNGRQEKHI